MTQATAAKRPPFTLWEDHVLDDLLAQRGKTKLMVMKAIFQLAFGGYVGALFNLSPMLDRDGTSPFQLEPERVGELIAWLGELPPDVVLKDLVIEPTSVGPFAVRRDVAPLSSSNDNQGAP